MNIWWGISGKITWDPAAELEQTGRKLQVFSLSKCYEIRYSSVGISASEVLAGEGRQVVVGRVGLEPTTTGL